MSASSPETNNLQPTDTCSCGGYHAHQVAAGRILHLLNADAVVTVVSPSSKGLNAEVAHRIARGQVTHVDRAFESRDLDDPALAMVLVAIDDPAASSEIWRLCRARRIPANIADVPPECDFYFGSVHRDGPLQVMVSTNGKGPRLANQIRRHIAAGLPPNAGRAVESVGRLRARLRAIAPDVEEGPKRMRWMIKVSDAFSFEDLCGLTDEDMENLLTFYAAGAVPTLDKLRSMRDEGHQPGVSQAGTETTANGVAEDIRFKLLI